jgi:dTDP-4-amino-4,6-dideoxygalactose transaminase
VLDAGDAVETVSGRYAIALALKQMGVGPGDEVLVPAYHCPAMIYPVIWTGAKPSFYRLGSDLSVDLDDVRAKLSDRTKSLMAVNYFGFPQNLSALRRFCDQHAICFLEDCAHSFFGQHEGRPFGSFGHYAIASTAKFFPVNEGGCLVSSHTPLRDIHMRPRGLWVSAKSAFNTLEEAVRYDRLPLLRPFVGLANHLLRLIPRPSKRRNASSQSDRGLVAGNLESRIEAFDENLVNQAVPAVSRLLRRAVPAAAIAERRRQNYIKLYQGLSGLSGVRPVFDHLPEGVVPYMFPLVVEGLERLFAKLEDQALPMQRFGQFPIDGTDTLPCAVSAKMARSGLQLACHQELRDVEVDWVIATFRQVVQGRS